MRVRLDHVATEVRRTVDVTSLEADAVFHYSIPAWDALGDGALEDPNEIGSGKTLLSGGEVLVSKLNPRKSRVVMVPRREVPTVCSGEFIALQPRAVDPRWLSYLLMSEDVRQSLDAGVQSATRSHQRVRPEQLTKMWLELPTEGEQRAIAHFLDAETARIDALIEKKRMLSGLLRERAAGIVEASIRKLVDVYGTQPLRFAAPEILVGIVVTPAAWYALEGVPALRGINIRAGSLDLSDLVLISREGHQAHSKSRLLSGDIVVVRTGQAGTACVVPPALHGANCIDLLIVRRSPRLQPEYLEWVLNSDWTRKHIEKHSVGTIQSHFNVGSMKELPVPVPPLPDQELVARSLGAAGAAAQRCVELVERQIDLLLEHRRAVITAALTGVVDARVAA